MPVLKGCGKRGGRSIGGPRCGVRENFGLMEQQAA
jgi:hypothetical protein